MACDDDGLPSFDRLRYRRHDDAVFLYAFDLIALDGDDLRRDPLTVRKATLRGVLAKAGVGLRYNEHMEYDDGETVFRHACKLGLNKRSQLRRRTNMFYRVPSNWVAKW